MLQYLTKINVNHFDLFLHDSVLSTYIFKAIGFLYIMLYDYESVGQNCLLQNKFRSL